MRVGHGFLSSSFWRCRHQQHSTSTPTREHGGMYLPFALSFSNFFPCSTNSHNTQRGRACGCSSSLFWYSNTHAKPNMTTRWVCRCVPAICTLSSLNFSLGLFALMGTSPLSVSPSPPGMRIGGALSSSLFQYCQAQCQLQYRRMKGMYSTCLSHRAPSHFQVYLGLFFDGNKLLLFPSLQIQCLTLTRTSLLLVLVSVSIVTTATMSS